MQQVQVPSHPICLGWYILDVAQGSGRRDRLEMEGETMTWVLSAAAAGRGMVTRRNETRWQAMRCDTMELVSVQN